MRLARLALLRAGLLPQVDAALLSLPGQGGDEARILWEYSAEVRRDNPIVAQITGAMGLSSGQVDELFRTAASI